MLENTIITGGTPLTEEQIAALTTEEASRYFCELKFYIKSFEAQCEAVKNSINARKDKPSMFVHPENYGGYKTTTGRSTYFIDPRKAVSLVTAATFYDMVSITKKSADEHLSPEAIDTLKKNGGYTQTGGTPSIEYIKP